MTVDLNGYDRSTHNKSYITRTTGSSGTLIPFLNEIGLPGDTWDVDIDVDVKTLPTEGPLFGSYKIQVDMFKAGIRLYQGRLHNNEFGLGQKMQDVVFPVFELAAPVINAADFQGDFGITQINPSSVLAHLGLMGIGQANVLAVDNGRTFNALSWIAYVDAYKNYYAAKQEGTGRVIHNQIYLVDNNVIQIDANGQTVPQMPVTASIPIYFGQQIEIAYSGGSLDLNDVMFLVRTGPQGNGSVAVVSAANLGTLVQDDGTTAFIRYEYTLIGATRYLEAWRYINETDVRMSSIGIKSFDLAAVDNMRQALLAWSFNFPTVPFSVNTFEPFVNMFDSNGVDRSIMGSQEGLLIKTYQSDMFNNWLDTETIEEMNERSNVSVAGGSFSMDSLLMARKIYDLYNRIAVAGNSYDDWQSAVWGMEMYSRSEIPVYCGGLSKELMFQEVVSNSETQDKPLGTLAGRGMVGKGQKGGRVTVKVDEPSVLLGIFSLTPRIDYSQGNDWSFWLKSMDELHKPEMDEIGFQDMIGEQFAWWDTIQLPAGNWSQKSYGKQPAWLNYMTNVNRVRGDFAIRDNSMFMVLNRRFEAVETGPFMTVADFTSYIDPEKFNQIFAQTALDAQNFWIQIGVDISVRRVMSYKIMPNL